MTAYLGAWIAILTVPGLVLLLIIRADRWLDDRQDDRRDRGEMYRQVDDALGDDNLRRAAQAALFAVPPINPEDDPS